MDKGWTRNLLVQVHRYLGLTLLVFLTLAASTGCLLVFSDSLDRALNPDLFRAPVAAGVLPATELAMRVQDGDPRLRVTATLLAVRPGHAVKMTVAPKAGHSPLGFDQVFVDPSDARVIGVRETRPGWDRAHLMQGVYLFHYTLLAGDAGRWFMGAMALGWVLENLVGFYLTLPKGGPFWRKWKPVWQVNLKASLPRLLLDLHRASGLWLFGGVMILSITSFALNYYSEVFQPAVVALSPPARTPWDSPAPRDTGALPRLGFADAERLALADARKDHLNLRPAIADYDPERRMYGVRFTGDGQEQYAGLGPISYYYDGQTGRRIFIDNPLTDSAGQKVLRSLFPLHSGQVGGLATRLLDCLFGLSILEMSVTGLIVWWKKRKPRVAARAARRAAKVAASQAIDHSAPGRRSA